MERRLLRVPDGVLCFAVDLAARLLSWQWAWDGRLERLSALRELD